MPTPPTLVRLQRQVLHRARPRRRLAGAVQQRHHAHVAAGAAQQDVGRVGGARAQRRQQRHRCDGVALQPGGGQQAAGSRREQLDVAVLGEQEHRGNQAAACGRGRASGAGEQGGRAAGGEGSRHGGAAERRSRRRRTSSRTGAMGAQHPLANQGHAQPAAPCAPTCVTRSSAALPGRKQRCWVGEREGERRVASTPGRPSSTTRPSLVPTCGGWRGAAGAGGGRRRWAALQVPGSEHG